MSSLLAEEEKKELELLRTFYQKVAHATVNHDRLPVPGSTDEYYAVVYPSTLGKLLDGVNKLWYYTTNTEVYSETSGT